jgi:hypothetical protein
MPIASRCASIRCAKIGGKPNAEQQGTGLLFHYTATATFQATYIKKNRQPASASLLGFRYDYWRLKYPVSGCLSIELIVSGLQFTKCELTVLAGLDACNFGSVLQHPYNYTPNRTTGSIRKLSADASKWLESRLFAAKDFGTQLAGGEKNSGDDRCKEDALSFH